MPSGLPKNSAGLFVLVAGCLVALAGVVALWTLALTSGRPALPGGVAAGPAGPAALDVIDIYDLWVSHPEEAQAKYQGKRLLVTGIVDETIDAGIVILVHLQHSRGERARRYNQDRILLGFAARPDYDMGFEPKVDLVSGGVTVPWRDGDRITILGTCQLGQKEGRPEIWLHRPVLR
jgi:hypothetical protein